MLEALMNILSLCWKPLGIDSVVRGDGSGREGRDGLLWFRDIGRFAGGEFSMSVVQANQVLEDQSQIESGRFGTFVGVYDGHGGPDAARYVCDHLFRNFRAISAETEGIITTETIRRAFRETEDGFTALVSDLWSTKPDIAAVGSCCLVGMIHQRTLFVANLGDSRVVLGRKVGTTDSIAAIQLSTEHNANIEAVRMELKELHPNDPQIVVLKHGVWRVKGIIQVSRSIGDVYMKHSQYNREPLNAKFRLSEPMNMPVLTANPSIIAHLLEPNDSFLIFASDGLWEHLSNEKAVEIVHIHPRAVPVLDIGERGKRVGIVGSKSLNIYGGAVDVVTKFSYYTREKLVQRRNEDPQIIYGGSAKRLVKAALHEAARKREMRYSDLRKIDGKVRRHFHDDITVIVLFLNHDLMSKGVGQDPPLSIRSALDHRLL